MPGLSNPKYLPSSHVTARPLSSINQFLAGNFLLGAITIAIILHAGEVAPAASYVISTSANPADGWRAIAPVGNLEGQSIASVGLAWESSHTGWNSSVAFDDSNSAGWHDPVERDVTRYGGTATNNIWASGAQGSGETPAYFRKVFILDAAPLNAKFGSSLSNFSNAIDDDVQIYVNGVLAFNDHDGLANDISTTDVTPYLHAGQNLLAAKAHDSAGGDEHFSLILQVTTVPEPSTLPLVLIGIMPLAATRRRFSLSAASREFRYRTPCKRLKTP